MIRADHIEFRQIIPPNNSTREPNKFIDNKKKPPEWRLLKYQLLGGGVGVYYRELFNCF